MIRIFIAVLVLVTALHATGYQWSVELTGIVSPETNRAPVSFLWIPPECARVRAVLVSQQNLEEEQIFNDSRFRQAMSRLCVAEVWISPAAEPNFRFDQGNPGESFERMFSDLANASGYSEIAKAPLIHLGHSAAASYPFNYAAWKPERTLAAISVSGQWPYNDPSKFNMGGRSLAGVPLLVTMGEYETAEGRSAEGLKERREHPELAIGMLGEPGAGHFDASPEKIDYLALYIRKALQYRLRPHGLRPIDPRNQGWLYDRWHRSAPPAAPAAPVGRYVGDPGNAWWTFDEEMARATEKLQAMYRGKKVDLLGYVQNGAVLPQVNGTHQQVTIPFQPLADGITFQLGGAFLDTVPAGRPETWTGLKQGAAVTHPASTSRIQVEKICGPVEQLAPDKFAVRFYRMGMDNRKRTGDIWLRVVHPGDDEYRRSVQQALLRIPLRNTAGRSQRISFPAIPDQFAGAKTVPLQATSDSTADVHYYVVSGPAEVDGATLRLTRIPPRAAFPVKVRVVAWQYGRSIEPLLQTAEPIERVFWIRKK
jgi:hypothetical protein